MVRGYSCSVHPSRYTIDHASRKGRSNIPTGAIDWFPMANCSIILRLMWLKKVFPIL